MLIHPTNILGLHDMLNLQEHLSREDVVRFALYCIETLEDLTSPWGGSSNSTSTSKVTWTSGSGKKLELEQDCIFLIKKWLISTEIERESLFNELKQKADKIMYGCPANYAIYCIINEDISLYFRFFAVSLDLCYPDDRFRLYRNIFNSLRSETTLKSPLIMPKYVKEGDELSILAFFDELEEHNEDIIQEKDGYLWLNFPFYDIYGKTKLDLAVKCAKDKWICIWFAKMYKHVIIA